MENERTWGRFGRYPGGTVPQSTRTPEEQLKHLDSCGLVATKERAKLKARIEKTAAEAVAAEAKNKKK